MSGAPDGRGVSPGPATPPAEPQMPGAGHALLRDALQEAQVTVRAYDTKAQIVGVGYVFTLNVIQQV